MNLTKKYRFYAGYGLFLDYSTVKLPSIEAETQRILDNIEAILMEARFSMRHVVKTTVFVDDIKNFDAINAVYAKAFKIDPPARSFVQVAALPKGAHLEIEVIARR